MPNGKIKEADLWSWLSKARLVYKARLHICRIENGVMNGMPDVEGCLEGTQFWIELKTCARPVRTTTTLKIRFEPGQLPWIKRRQEANGKAYVLLQVGKGYDARRYLVGHTTGKLLEEGYITEADLAFETLCSSTAKAKDILAAAARHHSG